MDKCTKKKRILILAPFFGTEGAWINDFCNRKDFEFKKAAYPNRPGSWHNRVRRRTPASEWLSHIRYARDALKWETDCVIACFPQLTLVVAALLLLKKQTKVRLIAWNFNLGSLPKGWKRRLAKSILSRVDRFVVHSRAEIEVYARWLAIDSGKFLFVPLQRGRIPETKSSPIPKPYIVSMGSANRDYNTLVKATIGTGIRTVIASRKDTIEALPSHPDLIKLEGLSEDECDAILNDAQLNVVPLAETQTASGQVSFTTSMRMGVPTIVTRCVSSIDYIRDGETGILVPPGDPIALRGKIELLWKDDELRHEIGLAGRNESEKNLSDEAAGQHLAQVLDEIYG